MSLKDQFKKFSTLGAFTLAGITSTLGGNTTPTEPIAPAPMHQTVKKSTPKSEKETKISTSYGAISYRTTQTGVQYQSSTGELDTSSIHPNIYRKGRLYECGPLKSYDLNTLNKMLEHNLKNMVIKESIAQNLKQKGKKQTLNQVENDFLKNHQKNMEKWGLSAQASKDGRIEITQTNSSGNKKITFSQQPYQESNLSLTAYRQSGSIR